MMNHNIHLNHSAALALSSGSARSSYAYYAASFFSTLRFYFYSFFAFHYPSERKPVS